MDAAAATFPPFGPGLALPLTVPLSVSQPHPRSQVGAHANAHACTHANSHPQANTHALSKPRASANAQIITDDHSLESVGDARWREEEMDPEEHESDFSRYQGDESTRSSCVTTPDIHLSRPPPLPLDGLKQGQVFDDSNLEPYMPSPAEHQSKRVSRLGSLSPPPPPPPNAASLSSPSTFMLHHDSLPPPPPPQSNGHTRPYPPPPPPPPSFGSDQYVFRINEAMSVVPPPPPPPPPRSLSPAESLEQDDQDFTPQPLRQYQFLPRAFGKPPSIPTSDEKSYQSRRGRTRRRRRRHSRNHSSGSTYSRTRPSTTQPSDSGSTSEEDPIQYRNARQFPPRLPTAPTYGSSGTNSKASINRITAWVADFEKTRSPRRQPRMEIAASSPLRHSDNYSDDAGGSDPSDMSSEGEIEMLWTQLKEKRTKLNDIKSQMVKRRKELRELRRKKDDADNAFMSVIRPILVNHRSISASHLERRLNEMQTLRSDYHFLEDSYETLEVMLDEEEAHLNSLETRFFSLLATGRTKPERLHVNRDPEQEQQDYFRNMPLDLKGISPDGPPEDRHPLYLDLMDTVGDLGNAKEEHEDLIRSKEQCTYVAEMNQSVGKPDDEGAAEFLAEFPEQEQQLSESIAKFQEGVTHLRKLCEEKGVMHKHMSARVEYLLYPKREYNDMDLEDKDAILERQHDLSHHQFPVLLSQPQHVLARDVPYTSLGALKAAVKIPKEAPERRSKMQQALKEYAIDNLITDYKSDRKSDFINRWLLQQLRTSPMNTALLHSTFVKKNGLKIRDFWRWQSDVLHYWWHDGGLAEESFKPVTSEDSQYRVGTTLPSRAASDGYKNHVRRQQRTDSSKAQTTVS